MEYSPLEEALRAELEDTPLIAGDQIDAAVLAEQLAEAEAPYLPGIDVNFRELSRKDRLNAYREMRAAKQLRAEVIAEYDMPSGARTFTAWYHQDRPVIKHFSLEPIRDYVNYEHVFLPPSIPETPRSELVVAETRRSGILRFRGIAMNSKNPDHLDLLVQSRANWADTRARANAELKKRFSSPAPGYLIDYKGLAQEVREYVVARLDDEFSLS